MAHLEIHSKRRDRSCFYLVISGQTHAWALVEFTRLHNYLPEILYCYNFNFNQGQNFSDPSLHHILEWKNSGLPFSLNYS